MAATIDASGARVISEMTDREIAEETLVWLRNMGAALEQISQSPMVKAMSNGQNPLMAMIGR